MNAKPSNMTSEAATRRGYRRVSNHYRIVSRIDRPDWNEALVPLLQRTLEEIKQHPEMWADWYRRCVSKDQITLDPDEYRKVPSSNWDTTGYVEDVNAGKGK